MPSVLFSGFDPTAFRFVAIDVTATPNAEPLAISGTI